MSTTKLFNYVILCLSVYPILMYDRLRLENDEVIGFISISLITIMYIPFCNLRIRHFRSTLFNSFIGTFLFWCIAVSGFFFMIFWLLKAVSAGLPSLRENLLGIRLPYIILYIDRVWIGVFMTIICGYLLYLRKSAKVFYLFLFIWFIHSFAMLGRTSVLQLVIFLVLRQVTFRGKVGVFRTLVLLVGAILLMFWITILRKASGVDFDLMRVLQEYFINYTLIPYIYMHDFILNTDFSNSDILIHYFGAVTAPLKMIGLDSYISIEQASTELFLGELGVNARAFRSFFFHSFYISQNVFGNFFYTGVFFIPLYFLHIVGLNVLSKGARAAYYIHFPYAIFNNSFGYLILFIICDIFLNACMKQVNYGRN